MQKTVARISELERAVDALSSRERATFDRIYEVVTTLGELRSPPSMHDWVRSQFGSLEAVARQQIVRIINRVTYEDTLFNALRSQRPIQMRNGLVIEEVMEASPDDPLRQPLENTPEDIFGRIKGRHSVTASNIAKLDGYSGLVVFDQHNPLRFSREEIRDYFAAGWQWAHRARYGDPEAVYYFFMWNCLWRAGASLLHGHAQMTLARHRHYGKVEQLRESALRYRQASWSDYFEDLYAVHEALGLGFHREGVRFLAHLTPTKEKETLILADPFDPALEDGVHDVLACFRDQLGVSSFNLALYQGPIGPVAEDWSGFPNIVRIVDRGDPHSRTSDFGGMELYAASVVSSDPFQLAEVLRSTI